MGKTMMLAVALCAACALASCDEKAKYKKMIIDETEQTRASLPQVIMSGTTITWVDMRVVGDTIMMEYELSRQDYDYYYNGDFTQTMASDRAKAQFLEGLTDFGLLDIIENSGMGFKYVLHNNENGQIFAELSIHPEEIKEIHGKMDKGEVESYTIMDQVRRNIAKLQLPMQVDEALWITDVYIDGTYVYYEYMLDMELEPSDIDAQTIKEEKASILQGLRDEPYIITWKDKATREGLHYVYIYKDNRGMELCRIDIGFDEI